MLCEYPNDGALDGPGVVEQVGSNSFDSVALVQKLGLPRGAWRTSYACKLIHRRVADLTFDCFAGVQHRKTKRQPLVVVSHDSAPRQRHRKLPLTPPPRVLRYGGVVERVGAVNPRYARASEFHLDLNNAVLVRRRS